MEAAGFGVAIGAWLGSKPQTSHGSVPDNHARRARRRVCNDPVRHLLYPQEIRGRSGGPDDGPGRKVEGLRVFDPIGGRESVIVQVRTNKSEGRVARGGGTVRVPGLVLAALLGLVLAAGASAALAQVKPGDVITPKNAYKVANLLSPGNGLLVRQGMTMNIISTGQLDWPNPYKAATEKYSQQVRLSTGGELGNYVAGLPFPLLDANDPQIGLKIMWNFSYRPLYTDDIDIREAEVESRTA